jgi:hypothetical protein
LCDRSFEIDRGQRLAILDTLKIDRKRKSMDAGKNRSGNILLELCRGNNLFIVNGRTGDDYLESLLSNFLILPSFV